MTLATVGLNTHIWNNNLRSLALLAFYPFLLLGLFWAIALAGGFMMTGAALSTPAPGAAAAFATGIVIDYAPLVMTAVLIWFAAAWFFNAHMIRKMAHAHTVTRAEEPILYNLLENMCISRGMKMPQLQIIETHARNAFASGIDERSYAITVTRGLLNSLSRDEVEAVLGHELTHIINRDVRLLIVSVIFTGMVGFAAQMVWSSLRHGALRSRRGRSGSHPGFALFMLAVLLILWLGYLATLLTRFALSRRREFMADAGAVQLTKNPGAMMSALLRISKRDVIPGAPADIALMCIENSQPFFGIFATHPPLEARLRALSETTGAPVPELADFRAPDEARLEPARRHNPWV